MSEESLTRVRIYPGRQGQHGIDRQSTRHALRPVQIFVMETVAGKKTVTPVGKLPSVIGHRIAASLFEEIPQVSEAERFISSRIGSPIDRPQVIDIRARLIRPSALPGVKTRIEDIVQQHLGRVIDLQRQFMNRALDLY